MKQLKTVREQIKANEKLAGSKNIPPETYKKLCRETEQLRTIERYLEHDPSESYLRETKKKYENIIKSKTAQFGVWFSTVKPHDVSDKNAKAYFNKENGLTHLRRQIKMINLILE